MRNTTLHLAAGMLLITIAGAPALAQLDCPVIASGGNATGDGSILVVGQVIIGDTGPDNDLAQGAVPCWSADGQFPVGDMNCDGIVSAADIDPFVIALTNPAGYAAQFPDCDILTGDINSDGNVSAADIDPFVTLLTGGK
jgi:hypothetical protein